MLDPNPSVTAAPSLREPLKNLGWLLGGRGINAVFSLLYLGLATRCLGLEGFGRFTLLVVMAQAIVGFAGFSTWQAIVRWGVIEGEESVATGFAMALDIVSVLAGSVIAFVVVWTAGLWLPLPPEHRWAAIALSLGSLIAIRSTPTGILRLHNRYDLAAVAEVALPATRAIGAVAAALLFPYVGGFVAAWMAAELACAAVYWTFAARITRLRLPDVSLRRMPARHAKVWRFVWSTSFSRSLAVSSKQIIILLVGALGGAALAGAFRVASQIGLAIVQLGEAVSRSVYPELVRMRRGAGRLAARASLLSLGAGGVATLLAAIIGKWGLTAVVGPDFAFAYVAMVALVAAGSVELSVASLDALLVADGKADTAFLIRLVPLVLALALLPSAITGWGLAGAACCILLSSVSTAIGLVYVTLSGVDDRR
jgi:O-antigen/teichoic acid export membrane protein